MRKGVYVALLATICAVFASAFTASAGATLPPGGSGYACESTATDTTFYGLDNTTHPGEIGFQMIADCNFVSYNFEVGSCLRQYNYSFGTWNNVVNGCATKTKTTGTLSLSHTLWYSCTNVTSTAAQTYDGKSVWSILEPNGTWYHMSDGSNLWNVTATHDSRCLGPVLAQVS